MLAGVALPVMPRIARSQCVTDTPAVDACLGGVRITAAPPSLDLSFMTPGTLPPALTFTRASTGTYFDATGTLQTATTNTSRWDYSPSALTLNGLLIEEARTNSIRNSTAAGATPGTPGTPPTNWVIATAPAGLSSQIVGTGTESGLPYCDVRVFGTTTATSTFTMLTEATLGIAALTGQAWCYSLYCKLVAGSFSGITITQFDLREVTSGGATVRDNLSSAQTITAAALNSQRLTYTVTLSGGATTAFVQTRLNCNVPISTAIDITLRIGAPQMEQGAGSTSAILTSSVAVTRAAEVCTAPTGAWFNAAASSLAADFIVGQAPNPSPSNARSPAALSDGTANNRLRLLGQIPNSANAVVATVVANVGTTGASLGNPAANAVAKMAGAWNGTTAVGSLNGAPTVSDRSRHAGGAYHAYGRQRFFRLGVLPQRLGAACAVLEHGTVCRPVAISDDMRSPPCHRSP